MKEVKKKTQNYKFFQNNKCEYFPCHRVKDPENFNCLFCYCPLYMLKDQCGGNFKYVHDIKDCSDCLIPHSKNAHDYIMSRMKEVIKIGSERR